MAAVAKGLDRVIWRYAGREVTCTNDGGVYKLAFVDGGRGPTISGLFDQTRHDTFTARNFARSLAGFFDAAFTTAERQSRPPH